MNTASSRGEAASPPPPFILIVDDHADIAEALCRLFRRVGYTCDAVLAGDAAIRALEQRRPDAVILDLMMPSVSGLQVLRWLRAEPRLRDVPVMIQTAATDPELLRNCMDAGATDIWLKGSLDFWQMLARMSKYAPRPED